MEEGEQQERGSAGETNEETRGKGGCKRLTVDRPDSSMRKCTMVLTAPKPAFSFRRALKRFSCPIVPGSGLSDTGPENHGCARISCVVSRRFGSTTCTREAERE